MNQQKRVRAQWSNQFDEWSSGALDIASAKVTSGKLLDMGWKKELNND